METSEQMKARHNKRRAMQKKRAERALKWHNRRDNVMQRFFKTKLVSGINRQ